MERGIGRPYRTGSPVRIETIELSHPSDPNAAIPSLTVSAGVAELTYRTHWDAATPYARLRFTGVAAARLGQPNDETLDSHPLYSYGLSFYEFQEVFGSPWIEKLRTQKANRFPAYSAFSSSRHFIYTFKDETFETIADGYELVPLEHPGEEQART